MNVNEVIEFVDKIVFDKTEKHLDDVQTAVVQGTWERQTYDDIAQECNVTKNYVGDVGAELWQILSKELGEDIKKTNFRSRFERLQITSLPIIIQNNNKQNNNHNFNFGSQTFNNSKKNQQNSTNNKSHYDLILAPKIINFYNRGTELQTLSNWILNQNTHLISVLGLSGIGKTTLVKRFVDLNLQQFEVIIWRNLKFPKSLDLLIDDLLNVCQQEAKATINDKLKQLFNIFKNKKCLIILDDLENIFVNCQFAGQYKPEYQDYKTFLQMITEIEHQSCLILISQEKCQEMISLDVFQSEVAEFIKENSLILTEDFKTLFCLMWMRLSEAEKEILLKISQNDQPISRDEIKQVLSLSSMDIINGLQSLTRRFLVSKLENDQKLYTLSPIFKEYLRIYHH
jgi:hypothetical protein